MQVKSIVECSNGSILQYFRPSLSSIFHKDLCFVIYERPFFTGFTVYIVVFYLMDVPYISLTSNGPVFSEKNMFKYMFKLCKACMSIATMYIPRSNVIIVYNVGYERSMKGFYHIRVWWPIWSCDKDH